jgi:hypothetical protein
VPWHSKAKGKHIRALPTRRQPFRCDHRFRSNRTPLRCPFFFEVLFGEVGKKWCIGYFYGDILTECTHISGKWWYIRPQSIFYSLNYILPGLFRFQHKTGYELTLQ